MTPNGVAAAGPVAGNFQRSLAMNPFLDPTRAQPDPRPHRLRGARLCEASQLRAVLMAIRYNQV